jgi:hypothetical protein
MLGMLDMLAKLLLLPAVVVWFLSCEVGKLFGEDCGILAIAAV